MATLTSQTIANTYLTLLRLSSATIGSGASAKYINDAADTSSALSISQTRVGIGVSDPAGILEVYQGSSGGAPCVYIENADVDEHTIQIAASNTTAHTITIAAEAQTTGNIISISAGNLTSGSAIYIDSDSDSDTARALVNIIQNHASSSGGVPLRLQQDGTGDIMQVFDTSTEVFTILDGGNVGIGVVAPAKTLDVNCGTDSVAGRFTSSSDLAFLQVTDNSEDVFFGVGHNGSADVATIGTHSSVHANNLTIADDGKVGIGTTSPASILQIGNGASSVNPIVTIHSDEASTDTIASVIHFKNRVSPDTYELAKMIVSTADAVSEGQITFQVNNGGGLADALHIDQDGYVGIGTAAPENVLEVSFTNATALAPNDVRDGNISGIHINNESDGGDCASVLQLGTNSGGIAVAIAGKRVDSTSGSMHFFTEKSGTTAQQMVIDEDGYVGIGTATPTHPLHVDLASNTYATFGTTTITDANENGIQIIGKKDGGNDTIAALGVGWHSNPTDGTNEACGFLALEPGEGTIQYLWCDDDNVLRMAEDNFVSLGGGTGEGTAVGDQTNSDERLKDISQDSFPYGLDEINKLIPIKYKRKKKIRKEGESANLTNGEGEYVSKNPEWQKVIGFESKPNARYELGFGAQTTQAIIPESVSGNKQKIDDSGNEQLVMTYRQIIPVLAKAVQELSAKVEALENNNQQGDSSNEQQEQQESAGSGDSGSSESTGEDSGGVEGDSADSSSSEESASESSESSSDDGNESSGSSGSDSSDDSEGGSGEDDSGGEASGEPSSEWTKDQLKAYMDDNEIAYNSGDTKQDLLDKISLAGEGPDEG
jgi:hypothetical protein